MPIPLPNLDDRRWADLVDDGRANIPRYAPAWTDHNIHDPGITVLDLFAWLAEMTNYRLNRVPSRHKRKFLELLGFQVLGPTPATAVLSFAPAPATAPFLLLAGTEFEGTDPDQKRIAFQTRRNLTVVASALQAVLVDDGSGTLADKTQDYADRLPIELFGAHPQTGSALYLGFDSLTSGVPFSLGAMFQGPGNEKIERDRILQEAEDAAIACAPVQTRIQCVAPPQAAPVALPPHHSVEVIWEAFTTTGWTPLNSDDDTRSLTLDGILTLTLPANLASQALGSIAAALFYIRCRMISGLYDAIPVLADLAVNAVRAQQAVPATETFSIKKTVVPTGTAPALGTTTQLTFTSDSGGNIGALAFGTGSGPDIRVWSHTAPGAAAGEITLDLEMVGVGSGLPGQQVALHQPQADTSGFQVFTLLGVQWQEWQVRADFDSSGRADFHFVLDPVTGVVAFGNGERGQTPAAGCMILARYRTTFADTGDLAAGVVNRPRTSPVNTVLLQGLPASAMSQLMTITTNRVSAQSGAAVETLEHALGRAVESLHAHERLLDLATANKQSTLDQIDGTAVRTLAAPPRGVNLLDLERIALAVPGTRVARARAWSSLTASFPCLDAQGVVTVVIVPEYPVAMPVPTQGLLDRVWGYLNRRRMVSTVLEITGPAYIRIAVAAQVALRTGASAAPVMQRILDALNTFLDPLLGGPDSLGWPFGRSVYRSEILQLIQDIPGVDYVGGMSMTSDSGGTQCGDIALCPTALTSSGAHSIEVL